MCKRNFVLFFLISVSALFPKLLGFVANAQSTPESIFSVTGTVEDEKKNSIPYATVAVSLSSSPSKVFKAIASDDYGRFTLMLPKGKYIFKFRSVGSKEGIRSVELDSLGVDLGTIVLQENITELREVVVRPLVEKNAREIIYNITSDPDREKSSMLNIFAKVPLLSVINGRITAENDPTKTIVILRNGRIDPLFSGGVSYNEVMRRLPAMGFTDIRILLDKPEKYKDYDYVISVTADKTQRLYGGVGESKASYQLDRNLNLGQRVTASADKIRMAGGIGYGWNKPLTSENSTSMLGTDYSTSNIDRTKSEANKYSGNVFLSQDISGKQFVSGRFSIAKSDANTYKYGITESHIGNQLVSLINNNTFLDNKSTSFEGHLAYQYDFKQHVKVFSMSYTVKTSPSENDQIQSFEDASASLLNSTLKQTKTHDYSHYFSMDYTDKLTPKLTLSGKAALLMSNTDRETRKYDTTTGTEIENINGYDYFKRPVNRIDGSLSLSWAPSNNIYFLTGIRPDYILNTSEIKLISGIDEPSYYNEHKWAFNTFFTTGITLGGKKTPSAMPTMPSFSSLTFNYSINQSRPSYYFLSNYIDDSNPNYIVTGNPFLKNETVHNLSVRLMNPKHIIPQLSYSFSNDRITRYWYETPDGKTVQSYINGGEYRSINLTLQKNVIFNGKNPQKMSTLTILLNGRYSEEKIEGNNTESYNLIGSVSHLMRIFNGYSLSSSLLYVGYYDSGYNVVKDAIPWDFSLMLSKPFRLKNGMRLLFSAKCADVFRWNKSTENIVNSEAFRMSQNSINRRIPVSVSLTLNFGSFKVKPVKSAMSAGQLDGFAAPGQEEIRITKD